MFFYVQIACWYLFSNLLITSQDQKQQAGELAKQKDGALFRDLVPYGNKVMPATLPSIGVTRKESSTSEIEIRAIREMGKLIDQKQQAGEIRKDGQSYGNSSCTSTEQELPSTLPGIGVTRKESRKRDTGTGCLILKKLDYQKEPHKI